MSKPETVVCCAEVPRGQMVRLVVGEVPICVAHAEDGSWCAIDDTCTHEDCSLSAGELTDHVVECPCHGSRFDIRTGAVLNLPAVMPVRTHQVEVVGDRVRLRVDLAQVA